MSYIVKEPDNLNWMSALSGVIGNNDTPWWGSDVTITPFGERHKNVGYIIKINGWDHLAVVLKRGDGLFRILTPDHDWLKRCDGYTTYEDFDENSYKKYFWETTIKLLQDHVDGEKDLVAYVEMPAIDYAEREKWARDGWHWCYVCERKLPKADFGENKHGRFGVHPWCKSCDMTMAGDE